MLIRRTGAAALLLVIMTACTIERTPRAGLADPTGVARAQIDTMLQEYEVALMSGDPRRIASFYTPGGRLYLPDTPDIQGRGAVDAAFTRMLDEVTIAEVELQSEDIDVVAEIAYQLGSFRRRLRAADGGERETRGRFMIRWVRGPETRWLIERMLVNHYGEPEVTATR